MKVSNLMPESNELPITLRVAEVARRLGVARSTIYAWVSDGLLPASRIGKVTLILWEDVQELLRTHRRPQSGS